MQINQAWNPKVPFLSPGIIFMPGTTQLKAKDILYRLQVSKAQGIVTTDTLAPEVDSVVSECPALKAKLLVSDHSRQGWLDFRSLTKWVSVLMNVFSEEGQGKTIHSQVLVDKHSVGERSPGLMPEAFSSELCHWFIVWAWSGSFPFLGCSCFFCKIRLLNFYASVTKQ